MAKCCSTAALTSRHLSTYALASLLLLAVTATVWCDLFWAHSRPQITQEDGRSQPDPPSVAICAAREPYGYGQISLSIPQGYIEWKDPGFILVFGFFGQSTDRITGGWKPIGCW